MGRQLQSCWFLHCSTELVGRGEQKTTEKGHSRDSRSGRHGPDSFLTLDADVVSRDQENMQISAPSTPGTVMGAGVHSPGCARPAASSTGARAPARVPRRALSAGPAPAARAGADSHGALEAGLPWESAPAMAPERWDCFSGGAAKIRFTAGRADLGWDLPVTKRVLAKGCPSVRKNELLLLGGVLRAAPGRTAPGTCGDRHHPCRAARGCRSPRGAAPSRSHR